MMTRIDSICCRWLFHRRYECCIGKAACLGKAFLPDHIGPSLSAIVEQNIRVLVIQFKFKFLWKFKIKHYLIDVEQSHSIGRYFDHRLKFRFQFEDCSIDVHWSNLCSAQNIFISNFDVDICDKVLSWWITSTRSP